MTVVTSKLFSGNFASSVAAEFGRKIYYNSVLARLMEKPKIKKIVEDNIGHGSVGYHLYKKGKVYTFEVFTFPEKDPAYGVDHTTSRSYFDVQVSPNGNCKIGDIKMRDSGRVVAFQIINAK